jgi:hypothetical protein
MGLGLGCGVEPLAYAVQCSRDDPWSYRRLRRVVPVGLMEGSEDSVDVGRTRVCTAAGLDVGAYVGDESIHTSLK